MYEFEGIGWSVTNLFGIDPRCIGAGLTPSYVRLHQTGETNGPIN